MRRIISFVVLVLICCVSSAQTNDNINYPITIKKGEIVKDGELTYMEIPVTHHNNTKDTLYYYNWSCSWQNFYRCNSNSLQVEQVPCDKNIFVILRIPPGKTSTVNLRLQILEPNKKDDILLCIGFNLFIATDPKRIPSFKEMRQKKNIIWSNEIPVSL